MTDRQPGIIDENDVLLATNRLISGLGPPLAMLEFPGTPVRRPSGKPFKMPERQKDRYRHMSSKHKRRVAQAEEWERLHDYRESVRFWLMQQYRGGTLQGSLFGIAEFYFERPKSRPKRDRSALVTVKPDAKNLMWALEDALNPRHTLVDRKRVKTWDGLWEDDARVHLYPLRLYVMATGENEVPILPSPKNEPGPSTRLRLWKID